LNIKIKKLLKMDAGESYLVGYPNILSYECSIKINEQMQRDICKIILGEVRGTGFFCKIPFPNIDNAISIKILNTY